MTNKIKQIVGYHNEHHTEIMAKKYPNGFIEEINSDCRLGRTGDKKYKSIRFVLPDNQARFAYIYINSNLFHVLFDNIEEDGIQIEMKNTYNISKYAYKAKKESIRLFKKRVKRIIKNIKRKEHKYMGAYTYLVNDKNKTRLFLSKGEWNTIFPTFSQYKEGKIFDIKTISYELMKRKLDRVVYGNCYVVIPNKGMRLWRLYSKIKKFIGDSKEIYAVCDYIEEDKYNEVSNSYSESSLFKTT